MPQYYTAIRALFVLTLLDRAFNTSDHDINFSTKTVVKWSILMKLWLGKVRYCDGEFRSKTSPRHNFINITIVSTYYAYKYR